MSTQYTPTKPRIDPTGRKPDGSTALPSAYLKQLEQFDSELQAAAAVAIRKCEVFATEASVANRCDGIWFAVHQRAENDTATHPTSPYCAESITTTSQKSSEHPTQSLAPTAVHVERAYTPADHFARLRKDEYEATSRVWRELTHAPKVAVVETKSASALGGVAPLAPFFDEAAETDIIAAFANLLFEVVTANALQILLKQHERFIVAASECYASLDMFNDKAQTRPQPPPTPPPPRKRIPGEDYKSPYSTNQPPFVAGDAAMMSVTINTSAGPGATHTSSSSVPKTKRAAKDPMRLATYMYYTNLRLAISQEARRVTLILKEIAATHTYDGRRHLHPYFVHMAHLLDALGVLRSVYGELRASMSELDPQQLSLSDPSQSASGDVRPYMSSKRVRSRASSTVPSPVQAAVRSPTADYFAMLGNSASAGVETRLRYYPQSAVVDALVCVTVQQLYPLSIVLNATPSSDTVSLVSTLAKKHTSVPTSATPKHVTSIVSDASRLGDMLRCQDPAWEQSRLAWLLSHLAVPAADFVRTMAIVKTAKLSAKCSAAISGRAQPRCQISQINDSLSENSGVKLDNLSSHLLKLTSAATIIESNVRALHADSDACPAELPHLVRDALSAIHDEIASVKLQILLLKRNIKRDTANIVDDFTVFNSSSSGSDLDDAGPERLDNADKLAPPLAAHKRDSRPSTVEISDDVMTVLDEALHSAHVNQVCRSLKIDPWGMAGSSRSEARTTLLDCDFGFEKDDIHRTGESSDHSPLLPPPDHTYPPEAVAIPTNDTSRAWIRRTPPPPPPTSEPPAYIIEPGVANADRPLSDVVTQWSVEETIANATDAFGPPWYCNNLVKESTDPVREIHRAVRMIQRENDRVPIYPHDTSSPFATAAAAHSLSRYGSFASSFRGSSVRQRSEEQPDDAEAIMSPNRLRRAIHRACTSPSPSSHSRPATAGPQNVAMQKQLVQCYSRLKQQQSAEAGYQHGVKAKRAAQAECMQDSMIASLTASVTDRGATALSSDSDDEVITDVRKPDLKAMRTAFLVSLDRACQRHKTVETLQLYFGANFDAVDCRGVPVTTSRRPTSPTPTNLRYLEMSNKWEDIRNENIERLIELRRRLLVNHRGWSNTAMKPSRESGSDSDSSTTDSVNELLDILDAEHGEGPSSDNLFGIYSGGSEFTGATRRELFKNLLKDEHARSNLGATADKALRFHLMRSVVSAKATHLPHRRDVQATCALAVSSQPRQRPKSASARILEKLDELKDLKAIIHRPTSPYAPCVDDITDRPKPKLERKTTPTTPTDIAADQLPQPPGTDVTRKSNVASIVDDLIAPFVAAHLAKREAGTLRQLAANTISGSTVSWNNKVGPHALSIPFESDLRRGVTPPVQTQSLSELSRQARTSKGHQPRGWQLPHREQLSANAQRTKYLASIFQEDPFWPRDDVAIQNHVQLRSEPTDSPPDGATLSALQMAPNARFNTSHAPNIPNRPISQQLSAKRPTAPAPRPQHKRQQKHAPRAQTDIRPARKPDAGSTTHIDPLLAKHLAHLGAKDSAHNVK